MNNKNEFQREDKVQVWDEWKHICLGWGEVIEMAYPVTDPKKLTVFVILKEKKYDCRVVWGNRYNIVSEKKALEDEERIRKELEQ